MGQAFTSIVMFDHFCRKTHISVAMNMARALRGHLLKNGRQCGEKLQAHYDLHESL